MTERTASRITVVSYNVHRFVGIDGLQDLERIAGVLREIEADVVALQEVEVGLSADDGIAPLETLAAAGGYRAVRGPTLNDDRGDYGNVTLTRLPVVATERVDLSVERREPRGALEVDVEVGHMIVRIVNTHLGLMGAERRLQTARLLARLPADDAHPYILIGDFNEWSPTSAVLRRLRMVFGRERSARTFPTRFPCLPLDRVWARPPTRIRDVRVHRSVLSCVASDHLPLCATVEIDPGRRRPGARRLSPVTSARRA